LTKSLPTRVLVDANFLIAWLSKKTNAETHARIGHLVDRMDKQRSRLVIPTPAVAEFLVGADLAGVASVNALSGKSSILIAPFDIKAAFELAQLDRAAKGAGDKRDGLSTPWQKLKIDRQIVAIARATGCDLIVSEDQNVNANATRVNIETCRIADLELPDSARQHRIPFDDSGAAKSNHVTPGKRGRDPKSETSD
jgi:predicted nucleic acid-binding protein